MNQVESIWREAFTPLERLSLVEFAKKYIKIGAKKDDFDLDLYRWVIEPMEVMTDYSRPFQAQIMAAQIGKGRSAEAAVPYFVAQDPADLTWYGMTNEKADEYAEDRLMPMLKNCEPVKKYLPENRHMMRKHSIIMSHMTLEVLGANETNTQSRTRQIIFCDEAWKWLPGMLAAAISRTDSPSLLGRRKVIITSTAGDEDCDLERYWNTCDQRAYTSRCPSCDKPHPFAMSRDMCRRVPAHVPVFSLKWDENETTKPAGMWNMEEVKKTVRMACGSCGHEFAESPEILRKLRESWQYIPMNPLASREKVGFWCPRMPAGKWAETVEKFLKVNDERKMGFEDNFKEFLIKDLAEKWVVGGSEVIEVNPTGDYDLADPPEDFYWDKEFDRFMAVDRQAVAPYFWYSVEAFSQNGESRRVEVGHCETKEEVEAIAERHGLVDKKSVQVAVDAGWDGPNKADHGDTWAWCAANRWYAFRGDDVVGYRHTKPGKKPIIKFYSMPIRRAVGMGTRHQGKVEVEDEAGNKKMKEAFCPEFMWSNLSIKSFLSRLKGGNGLYYGIARNVPDFYLKHMDSEYKKAIMTGKKTVYRFMRRGKRPNHLWDCACMNLVAAFMAGLIPMALASAEDDDEDEKVDIEKVA